jgi:hypothetical protein
LTSDGALTEMEDVVDDSPVTECSGPPRTDHRRREDGRNPARVEAAHRPRVEQVGADLAGFLQKTGAR